MIDYKCTKCGEEEISELDIIHIDGNRRIIINCKCNICGHRFALAYYLKSWYDRHIIKNE